MDNASYAPSPQKGTEDNVAPIPKGKITSTFTPDTVAVLVMAIRKNNRSLVGLYKLMAELDPGKRTQSGFEHQFRPIVKRADELSTMVENGTLSVDGNKKTAAASNKRKAGESPAADGSHADYEGNNDAPPKKGRSSGRKKQATGSSGATKKRSTNKGGEYPLPPPRTVDFANVFNPAVAPPPQFSSHPNFGMHNAHFGGNPHGFAAAQNANTVVQTESQNPADPNGRQVNTIPEFGELI
ncbi:hypothetical protein BDY21DRAFT_369674 [Lineolata rhizophorae]|uniref:Uncharacterized protein n=1 Tax=Lineolata rhizophorae TaxID=578093 RepID=A0A6A6P6U7_9PEZI|nr:hypothetical protein BDY21DRAFT_369674 [Lineolata rhizophorae]